MNRSVIPVAAMLLALALLVAGVVTWRMFSGLPPHHPSHRVAGPSVVAYFYPVHRLHPLRAELLWAASAVFALIAVGAGLRARRRPTAGRPAAG